MKEMKNKEKQQTAAPKKRLSLKQREGMMGYLFVLPWIIGVLIFVLRPLAQSFNFALSRVKMTPKGREITFIGIQNFTQILQEDETFPTELAA